MSNPQNINNLDQIAVIGMAGRFPGANNIEVLWQNLKNGFEAKITFSDEALLAAGVPQAIIDRPNYVKNRSILDDAELFDAAFFGFTPREAEFTDPQHRIFLECAWEALESSGYDPAAYEGSIGVFAGCGMNQYLLQNIASNPELLSLINERQLQVCSDKDFLATRVSYKLNLKGPSLDIQTACSTSLVAVHLACQNLADYQCDIALCGGSHLQLPRVGGFLYNDGDMRSPEGTCKAFDADAKGTVFGDGAAIVVLKRLEDAIHDKDTIYALIKGSAINNDGGRKAGFSAPSVEGQAGVISAAHMMAGVSPESISYIEAHGTGTALGDPIEVAALTKAFRKITEKTGFCAIGSIKPNIGHLDAASGVTGLIKTVLALHHKQIPPNINFHKPNPLLNISSSPFYVATKLMDWKSTASPRRAGVSSFGVGGTNAHVILEEAPVLPPSDRAEQWHALTLSAKSEDALNQASSNLLTYLETHPDTNLVDAAFTLNLGRRHFDYRLAIVCKNVSEAIDALTSASPQYSLAGKTLADNPSAVFLFTGQGSQYPGMAQELYGSESVFRNTIDYCADVLRPIMGLDIRESIFGDPNASGDPSKTINQTEIAQPALFVIEYALAKMWAKYGITPTMMIGHSIGEYVAACLSGVFNLDDALRIVAARGRLMQRQPGGCMISISLSEEAVAPYLNDGVELSVINSPTSVVLSGGFESMEKLDQRLEIDGVRYVRLHTSHAFHSKMMEPALAEFEDVFQDVLLNPPRIPFISNLTGDFITPDEATNPAYWVKHLRHAVRFSDGICRLLQDPDLFLIELGPGNTLSSLVRQTLPYMAKVSGASGKVQIFSSLRHPKQQISDRAFFIQNLARYWIAGGIINWKELFENRTCYRISLPTYPFERKKFWIEPGTRHQTVASTGVDPELKHIVDEGEFGTFSDSAIMGSDASAGPESKIVQMVIQIWKDLLGYNHIGPADNFFDLGGDSLCASQVLSRITDHTGIILNLGDLFDHPTIDSFSKLIESRTTDVFEPMERPVKRQSRDRNLPLSRGQQRLWFLSRLEPESAAFNLSLGIRIEGPLKIELLRKAIKAIVERHETLRTTFAEENGVASVVIHDQADIELNYIDGTGMEGGEPEALRRIKASSVIPYDLERGPLTRWHLLHLGPEAHVLVYQVHHIIFDGWSLGIVLKELGELYEAYEQGRAVSLPELSAQYVDCAGWYEQWLKDHDLKDQIAYWHHQLRGQLPVLQLLLDRPRPKVPSYFGALESFELSKELSSKIKALAKREGVTFFMFFLAAYKVLLFRYSGQKDIIIGTPVAYRNHIEMEKVVGFFINMLALRSDLTDNPAFNQFLAKVKKTAIDGFANQDLLFEQLVDILQPPRDTNYHPVYQAMFAFHNFSFPQIELQSIRLKNIMVDRGASQLDFWLQLWEEDNVFKGTVEYSTELFEPSTIAQMIDSYLTLLEGIAAEPEKGIETYPLLSPKQKDAIVYDLNRTQLALPQVDAFHQLFEIQADRVPQNVAVVFEDQFLTYAQLEGRSNQLAHYLITLGAGPDVLIGVYVERSLEMMVAVLGILKVGSAYVPLDPTYPAERIAFMIEDARMPVILTQDKLEGSLPANQAVIVCLDADWEEIAQEADSRPALSAKADNLAYVIFTSGSTGRPKGVQIPHGAVVNFLTSMGREPGLSQDDVLLAVTTLSFDIHVLEIYLPLTVGSRTVIASRETASDGERLLKLLEASKATIMQATPSTWRLLLAAGWQGNRNLTILCGGEAFPRDLAKELLSRAKCIWNMYGPTETTVWSSCYRIVENNAPILIGRPIANTQIYILDYRMQPVPLGVAGELHIGGLGVTRGYLGRPDLTEKQFVPDPFRQVPGARLYKTGDLARMRADGNLEYISRIDTQVKVRGFRIELGEIESVLATHPVVKKCVAAVREDRPGDVRLVGYVVPRGELEMDASSLRNHLRTRLPDYMVPQHFVALTDVPLTPAGKIDRKNLPAVEGGIVMSAEYVAPRNETEEMLAAMWQELIGLDRIGINENFFEIGGNSILALKLIHKINDSFQIEIPLRQLFDTPTVADFAAALEDAMSARNDGVEEVGNTPIERQSRDRNLPLSRGQQRLWFLSRLEPESAAFNLSLGIRIEGPLKIELLRKAIKAIVERHETLRTTFAEENGVASVVIHDQADIELNYIDGTGMEGGEPEALRRIKASSVIPYDLERGPLTRWHLLHLGPEAHVLVYQVHHIIFDGWSLGIVLKELGELYEAYEQGRAVSLPELSAQYVDCAGWYEQWLKDHDLKDQIAYWHHQLRGQLPVLQLLLDRPRPKVPSYFGALESFELSKELSSKIKALAKREGVTFFMFFLAAYKVLLFRYSGQKDIIIGTPVAYRNHIEMEKVVGFFINMLALRSDLTDNPAFNQFLAKVKKTAIDGFANQDLLFEQLVDILQPPRDTNYHPVYQAMFAFHNFSFPQIELQSIRLKNIMVDRGASQLDFWLQLWEEDNVFKGTVEYSTELFEPSTIAQMIDSYLTLLEGIAAEPEKGIETYPLLSPKQKDAIVYDLNRTQLALPQVDAFHQLFEIQADRVPQNVAVVFEDQFLTYAQLEGRSNQLAHYLITLGAGPDVLIGVYVERSLEMMVAVLGILKVGSAYVPLDPTYPAERIAFMIEDARMPVILTQDKLEGSLPANQAVIVCLDADWEEIAQEADSRPALSAKADNLAYVIFTSGSTGRPKGVQIPHGAVVNFLTSMGREPGLSQDDVLLAVTTLSFDIHVLEIYLPLTVGSRTVIASRETASDGERLLKLLEASKATIMQATPSTWRLLLAAGWQGNRNLTILCGGEAFPRDLAKELLSRAKCIWNMYGPTETTVWSSCYRIVENNAPILIGRPIANTQIYILDYRMQPVPLGVAGELHIGGLGVTRGYLGRPDLTEKQFVPDPFRQVPGARLYKTGDLARMRADGNLEYISRIDTQVKVRGFRIELGEIESVLATHPVVKKCVAAVREDRPGDVRLVGYVVPRGELEMDASSLRNHLRTRLPDYMVPQHFVALTDVPLTPAGKIDRKNLPAVEGGIVMSAEYVAPRNETEEMLAAMWQELIGLDRIGINENFFEIGGNSILALKLIHKINDSFQIEIPLRQLFDTPTVADFAAALEDALLAEIEALTDEEAERLLTNEK